MLCSKYCQNVNVARICEMHYGKSMSLHTYCCFPSTVNVGFPFLFCLVWWFYKVTWKVLFVSSYSSMTI